MAMEGVTRSIEADPKAPRDVLKWCVLDYNKFQSGSHFSAQQLFSACEEYQLS